MIELIFSKYYNLKFRLIRSYHYRIKKNKCLLETELLNNDQTIWLDLGSSINHNNQNFHFADLYPIEECLEEMKDKYHQLDISKPLEKDTKNKLGKFDLIRMQHVFEHFTYEQASIVLDNCYELLEEDGKLLISVPDLDIYLKRYFSGTLKHISSFGPWSHKGIKENSPQSDYFSIYAHSMIYEKHLWCYNKKGLINKIRSTGNFKNIKKVSLFNKLAGIPFTHNRPEEDLCVIATKK